MSLMICCINVILSLIAVYCSGSSVDNFIPELDMNTWRLGDASMRQTFALSWSIAFETVGFITLLNTGIPQTVSTELFTAMKRFYDMPKTDRMKYQAQAAGMPGYSPYGRERQQGTVDIDKSDNNSNDKKHPDMVESWQFISSDEYLTPAELISNTTLFAPYSPEGSPEWLRLSVSNYWPYVKALLMDLLDITDAALEMPLGSMRREYFDMPPTLALRLSDYFIPAMDQCVGSDNTINNNNDYHNECGQDTYSADALRMGAHTDYLGYTILKTDGKPGLEVFNADTGEWHPVNIQAQSDAVIVNAGDLFHYWTNGEWKAALHRVVQHPDRRLSAVFFTGPNIGQHTRSTTNVLSCPICLSNEPRYAHYVVSAKEHCARKWAAGRL
jgi:isopenicillin N synthase-like dioxygenase